MKHKLSILAVFAMVLSQPMAVNAEFSYTYQDQTLYFTIIGDAAKAVNHYSYGDLTGDLVIPDSVTYGGTTYPVTSIGQYAFEGCSGLTSVTIPNTVTAIGERAFKWCEGLTSVIIPNSVISIGDQAFDVCSGLTTVTIGNSVDTIGKEAFGFCTSLDTINYYATNCTSIGSFEGSSYYSAWPEYSEEATTLNIGENVISIPNNAFRDCHSLTSVTIGNSVTTIGSSAFEGCALTSVSIPNSVTTIGGSAFYGCSRLTSVTIPNSVTTIGGYAFYNCSRLTSVTIPDSVTTINAWTFYNCSSITSVIIPNSVTSIGIGAFDGCTMLTSITIPNSVTWIGETAFFGCSSLDTINYNATNCTYIGRVTGDNYYPVWPTGTVTTLNIGENVISIPDIAFRGCTRLTSVTIPNSVTSIGSNAFIGCSSLATINYNATNCTSIGRIDGSTYYKAWPSEAVTTLNIGENVSSIPDFAFAFCTNLTTVNFNATNCTTMGSGNLYAFYGCTNLRNVSIGNNVTRIPAYAFMGCSGLTSVAIPASVTSIGYAAFYDCSGLTSIGIPSSVTSIGGYAFYNCSGLTSVSLPNSVTTIGSLAFRGCSGLTSITLPNSLDSISYGTFSRCSGLTSISIPSSVTSIGNSAFYNCSGLTTISIPEGVGSIGGCAFSGCSGLTNVTIASSVTSIGDSAFAGGDHIIQMTCNAAVPPTVANVNAFDDVFRGIPLYVPAASLSSYRVAYGWREFTNFIGMSTYTITATGNNPAWGTVSGGGSYGDGATATLTAMPNAGYRFVRWHDGNTQNPRTVTVTGDATYTAYFESIGGTEGIDGVDGNEVHVFSNNGRIYVETATLTDMPAVEVYDMAGRRVAIVSAGEGSPELPVGVYVVKVGTYTIQKVVVVK